MSSAPESGCVAAADVGGTRIKAALVRSDGTMLVSTATDTGDDHSPAAVVHRVAATLGALCREAGRQPSAVGLAMCGLFDDAAGVSLRGANLGWRDVPVRELLQREFQVPVHAIHDVRAGGLAEARLGAARGVGRALFVPIGTGIAAALLRDGQPDAGAHYMSGELGHLPVVPDGRRCGCGGTGCLETVASATAIARTYREASGEQGVTAAMVAARARAGEETAGAVWQQAVGYLGGALAVSQMLLDPAVVVLGGGLSLAGELLLEPLRAAMARSLPFHPMPELETSRLGEYAGCLGAAIAAWDRLRHKESAAITAPRTR